MQWTLSKYEAKRRTCLYRFLRAAPAPRGRLGFVVPPSQSRCCRGAALKERPSNSDGHTELLCSCLICDFKLQTPGAPVAVVIREGHNEEPVLSKGVFGF